MTNAQKIQVWNVVEALIERGEDIRTVTRKLEGLACPGTIRRYYRTIADCLNGNASFRRTAYNSEKFRRTVT